MADPEGGAMAVVVRASPSPIASASTAVTNPATKPANEQAASKSDQFRTDALAAVRAARLEPLPANVPQTMSMSARIALVAGQLIEPGDPHSFLLATPVDGASDLANASSLTSVVKALMPETSFKAEGEAASWIRALCGDPRLALARSTTWSGAILFTEAATTEQAFSCELAFLARDSNVLRPRPFLGVRYVPSEVLAPRLELVQALGLLGVSTRAALTIVATAMRTIVPRPPLAAPSRQPALVVDSGGLADLTRRMADVVDAVPVGQMRTMLDSLRQRLQSEEGREYVALMRETAQWLREGASAAPQGTRLLAWFKGIFLLDAAAGLLSGPPPNADQSRQTEPYPIQPVAASLPPTPESAAASLGPQSPSACAKRPRCSFASAEEVAAMDADDLATFGLQLAAQVQLLAQENAKRATPTAARRPLRQRMNEACS